jgi:putative ABC transport system permease protein
VSLVEVVRFAFRGLWANRLRSLLTMLGIIIGIAAVILLTALGNGASQYIQSQIAGLGANSITVLPRQPPESAGTDGRPLTQADVEALGDPQGAPDIASVSGVVTASVTVDAGRASSGATIVGSVPSYFPGANVQIATGRAYTEADVTAGRKVALLGATVVGDLFGANADPVGRTVLVNGVPFDVIGTLVPSGNGGGLSNPDENVLTPLTAVQGSLTGFGDLSRIVVQARSTEAQAAAETEVNTGSTPRTTATSR